MEQLKKELLQFGCKGKVAAIVLLVLGLLNVGLLACSRQTTQRLIRMERHMI